MASRSPAGRVADALARSVIAPSLRERGFARRGNRWTHEADGWFRHVDLQKSTGTWKTWGKFTLNLSFGLPSELWRPFGGGFRVGRLLPIGRDYWWEVVDADDAAQVDALAVRFSADWGEFILPFLDAAASREDLLEFVPRTCSTSAVLELVGAPEGIFELEQRRSLFRALLDRKRLRPDDFDVVYDDQRW